MHEVEQFIEIDLPYPDGSLFIMYKQDIFVLKHSFFDEYLYPIKEKIIINLN